MRIQITTTDGEAAAPINLGASATSPNNPLCNQFIARADQTLQNLQDLHVQLQKLKTTVQHHYSLALPSKDDPTVNNSETPDLDLAFKRYRRVFTAFNNAHAEMTAVALRFSQQTKGNASDDLSTGRGCDGAAQELMRRRAEAQNLRNRYMQAGQIQKLRKVPSPPKSMARDRRLPMVQAPGQALGSAGQQVGVSRFTPAHLRSSTSAQRGVAKITTHRHPHGRASAGTDGATRGAASSASTGILTATVTESQATRLTPQQKTMMSEQPYLALQYSADPILASIALAQSRRRAWNNAASASSGTYLRAASPPQPPRPAHPTLPVRSTVPAAAVFSTADDLADHLAAADSDTVTSNAISLPIQERLRQEQDQARQRLAATSNSIVDGVDRLNLNDRLSQESQDEAGKDLL